jgi:O-antigen/teichoic acid export membrane protein
MKKNSKKLFKFFLDNPVVGGSLILFVGNMIANAGSYFYHLIMGRMLGPSDYGALSSLISLSYIFSIPVVGLNMVVMKYISALKGGAGLGAALDFYKWLGKKLLRLSFVIFWLMGFMSPLLASFLHLSSVFPIILINFLGLLGIFVSLNTYTLQGLLRFGSVALVSVVQAILRLLTAFFLVWWGYKVLGALFSFLISSVVALALGFFLVKRVFGPNVSDYIQPKPKSKEIFEYGFPVLLASIAFTFFYTSDILLVKHFLPPVQAGFYASLALLGKIVFFASSSVGQAMFPIVSGKNAKGEDYRKTLFLSFLLVVTVSLAVTGLYFLIPKIMIEILFGKQYLAVASDLGFFGKKGS